MKNEIDGGWKITSRNTAQATIIARKLTRWGITPNQISMMSVSFAMVGCLLLIGTIIDPGFNRYVAYILSIVCMQSRLFCNLFDGMVAIEEGKKSANGDLYNDMPNHFAGVLFIIPAGYITGGFGIELGWLTALLAVITAYSRWIRTYKTYQHFFNGPMTKQHRMALLALAFVIAIRTTHVGYDRMVCLIALIIINVGLVATLIHRLYLMSRTTDNEIKWKNYWISYFLR